MASLMLHSKPTIQTKAKTKQKKREEVVQRIGLVQQRQVQLQLARQ